MQKNETAKSAKEIVTQFMQAMERKDWKTVRNHISDNISVLAPGPAKPITFHQAEAYMYYLEHATGPPPEIKKVIADGNDVCVTLEVTYPEPPQPVTALVCGLFHVNDDGKIGSIRFVLDPRELFQKLGYWHDYSVWCKKSGTAQSSQAGALGCYIVSAGTPKPYRLAEIGWIE